MEKKSVGLYIHVPFCRSKCEYCDFYSIACKKHADVMEEYCQALLLHLKEASFRATEYEVDTVYFGGGTPSFWGDDPMRRILAEIDRRFSLRPDAEITLEANPDI